MAFLYVLEIVLGKKLLFVLVFNNGLTICFGRSLRTASDIYDIVSWRYTLPITYTEAIYSYAGITGTANGVVGITDESLSVILCSMKPTTQMTSNRQCMFIIIGI